MKARSLGSLALAGLITATMAASVLADSMPTEPLGGKPPAGSMVSIEDLTDQVTYHRAFEAVIWSMPAVAKYGMRRASIEIGAADNVVMAWSAGATPLLETLTPNPA